MRPLDGREAAYVRNPVLRLPGYVKLQALPPELRQALKDVLVEIALDARARAQRSWKQNKAPMALYWKCVSVWFGHIARGLIQ